MKTIFAAFAILATLVITADLALLHGLTRALLALVGIHI